MEQDNDFEPDGFDTARDAAGNVRLRFYKDDGQAVSVVIPGGALPLLLQELQRRIGSAGGQTIAAVDLQLGRSFRTESTSVRKTPDGGALLTFGVELQDPHRVVTMPFHFTPEGVAALLDDLKG